MMYETNNKGSHATYCLQEPFFGKYLIIEKYLSINTTSCWGWMTFTFAKWSARSGGGLWEGDDDKPFGCIMWFHAERWHLFFGSKSKASHLKRFAMNLKINCFLQCVCLCMWLLVTWYLLYYNIDLIQYQMHEHPTNSTLHTIFTYDEID